MSADHSFSSSDISISLDVLIVGANIPGLILSIDLAKRGINYMIVDKGDEEEIEINEFSQGVFLNQRSLEILKGVGILEEVLNNGYIVNGVDLFIKGSKVCSLELFLTSCELSLSYPIVIEKNKLRKILYEKLYSIGGKVHNPIVLWRINSFDKIFLQESPSIDKIDINSRNFSKYTIFDNVSFAHNSNSPFDVNSSEASFTTKSETNSVNYTLSEDSINDEENSNVAYHQLGINSHHKYRPSIVAHLKSLKKIEPTSAYENEFLTANVKYLIGVDGTNSFVRKAAEIPFIKSQPLIKIVEVVADIIWPQSIDTRRVQLLVSSLAFVQCYPLGYDRWYLAINCYDSSENLDLHLSNNISTKSILNQTLPESASFEILWDRSFNVEPKTASLLIKGSVMIAGTAAHTYYPLFNYDLNLGIQEVNNLGWKLATAIFYKSHENILKSYDWERRLNQIRNPCEGLFLLFFSKDYLLLNSRLSCLALQALFYTLNKVKCITSKLNSFLFMEGQFYQHNNDTIVKSRLWKSTTTTGKLFPDLNIKELQISKKGDKIIAQKDLSISKLFPGGHHLLILCLTLCRPEIKATNNFGCEIKRSTDNWCSEVFENLAGLGRTLGELFIPQKITFEGLKVIWLLCGLGHKPIYDTSNIEDYYGIDIPNHWIPARLIKSIIKSNIRPECKIVVEMSKDILKTLGLDLVPPIYKSTETLNGCFILMRPDGHICHNGYSRDHIAFSNVISYARKYYS